MLDLSSDSVSMGTPSPDSELSFVAGCGDAVDSDIFPGCGVLET